MTRVALDHLVGWLEAGVGDLGDAELLVVRLLSRDHGRVGHLSTDRVHSMFCVILVQKVFRIICAIF